MTRGRGIKLLRPVDGGSGAVVVVGVGEGYRGAPDRQDQHGYEGNPDARVRARTAAPAGDPVGSTHGLSRYPFADGSPSENF
ncbi:MAG: hypothetical protein ACXVFA_20230, partial [Solirubrobacteraceae bacterium]